MMRERIEVHSKADRVKSRELMPNELDVVNGGWWWVGMEAQVDKPQQLMPQGFVGSFLGGGSSLG
jgi:hypothetical protein